MFSVRSGVRLKRCHQAFTFWKDWISYTGGLTRAAATLSDLAYGRYHFWGNSAPAVFIDHFFQPRQFLRSHPAGNSSEVLSMLDEPYEANRQTHRGIGGEKHRPNLVPKVAQGYHQRD